MNTQRQEIAVQTKENFTPRVIQKKEYSLDEIEFLSKKFSESSLCPSAFKGRPADVFAMMCVGREMNLSPMQSMQFLGSINGLPFAYGDGLTALCQRHPEYIGIEEHMEGKIEDNTAIYYCTFKRKGKPDVTNHYSMAEAIKAGLMTKDNWRKHPRRMLQRRARAYAAKDQFADALMGLISEDEAEDIVRIEEIPQPTNKGMGGFKELLGVKQEVVEAEIIDNRPLLEQLTSLIIEKGVPDQTVENWKKKANVNGIDELNDETLTKIINHLKTKENVNGLHTANGRADQGVEPNRAGDI